MVVEHRSRGPGAAERRGRHATSNLRCARVLGRVLVTLALLLAGVLALWGYAFANGNVHDELSSQKIFFPPRGSPALASPEIGPYLNQYAGQQLVNGAQAKAYADHFIAVHVKQAAGGQTYAQLSTKARQNPSDTALAAQVNTLFKGETLRGLLLNAYAFGKIAQLALIGSIVSFALAVIMALLSILGFLHLRRVPPDQQVLASRPQAPTTATADAKAG